MVPATCGRGGPPPLCLDIVQSAAGIGAIGLALMAFGVGSLIAGFGAFFGGDPVKHFKKFADIGDPLEKAANAITTIAESVNLFGEIKSQSEQLSSASSNIMGYAEALMAAAGAQGVFAASAALTLPFLGVMAMASKVSGLFGGKDDVQQVQVVGDDGNVEIVKELRELKHLRQ